MSMACETWYCINIVPKPNLSDYSDPFFICRETQQTYVKLVSVFHLEAAHLYIINYYFYITNESIL